jgi:biopolymer transport protein ExbD
MGMKSKAKGLGSVGFNMTPMIDCVFQLLIFLMVTRHFYELRTVQVQLPPASKAESMMSELPKFEQVVINIVSPLDSVDPEDQRTKTTKVIIDGNTIVASKEGGDIPNWEPLVNYLKTRVADAKKGSGKPVNVILRASQNVPYETIGSVMLSTTLANIGYWWIQTWRAVSPRDDDKLKFLGVPVSEGN